MSSHSYLVKRYLLATHWSKSRGATFLGRKESHNSSVQDILCLFPASLNTIYVIVEYEDDDIPIKQEKKEPGIKQEKKEIGRASCRERV